MNVYLLPGIGGCQLAIAGTTCWGPTELNLGLSAALGNLQRLRLDPSGAPVEPTTVTGLFGAYEEWAANLPGQVLLYDWRLDPYRAAIGLVEAIQAPAVLVCHSYGGAVGLAIQEQLINTGQGGTIQGMIFLGSPLNYDTGNWSAFQTMSGRGSAMDQLGQAAWVGAAAQIGLFLTAPVVALGAGFAGLNATGQQLCQVVATWRSLGVLLPSDPLTRSAQFWAALNPYVTADFLQATLLRKSWLRNVQLPCYFNVYSQGVYTTTGWAPGLPGLAEVTPGTNLIVVANGDGNVQFGEQLPNAGQDPPIAVIRSSCDHMGLLTDPAVTDAVEGILGQIHFGLCEGDWALPLEPSGSTQIVEDPLPQLTTLPPGNGSRTPDIFVEFPVPPPPAQPVVMPSIPQAPKDP